MESMDVSHERSPADTLLSPHDEAHALAKSAKTHNYCEDPEGGEHYRSSLLPIVYCKPIPRQLWLKDGSSSLQHLEEERVATSNDLVLDLMYVLILSRLGSSFRSSLAAENCTE